MTYDAQQRLAATATWASAETDGEGGSLTVTYVGIDGTDYASLTAAPKEVGEYQAWPASRATPTTRGADRPTSPSPRPRPRSRSRASAARRRLGERVISRPRRGRRDDRGPLREQHDLQRRPGPAGKLELRATRTMPVSRQRHGHDRPGGLDSDGDAGLEQRDYHARAARATATWASTGTERQGGSLTVTYVGIDGTNASSTTAPTEVGEYQGPPPASRATRTTGSSNTADFAITPATATITVTGFSRQTSGRRRGQQFGHGRGRHATIAGLSVEQHDLQGHPGRPGGLELHGEPGLRQSERRRHGHDRPGGLDGDGDAGVEQRDLRAHSTARRRPGPARERTTRAGR